ncbi:DUF1493 family protein [Phytobacter diazotrophicus]|nr:DUF1493 family protein [Phytobacter diazotrophicus]
MFRCSSNPNKRETCRNLDDKKPLTIRMFIDSAKAGRWLSQGQVW